MMTRYVGPDDAETFEMELSGFLREYGMLMLLSFYIFYIKHWLWSLFVF